MKKTPKCKGCKKEGHYQISCRATPKKPILSRSKPVKTVKQKTTRPKVKSRSHLVKELDSVFSKYIRIVKSIDGVGKCITCGETDSWVYLQCGHFFTRGRYATRWDLDNCHIQCLRCNVFLNGNYINYTRYMIDRYGRKFVDELERKSLTTVKITTAEIKDMIQEYKDKLHGKE